MIDLIADNSYTPFLLNLIKDSSVNIFCSIFHAHASSKDLYNPVNMIFDELLKARKRNVFVSCCFAHYGISQQMKNDNLSCACFLDKNNIECLFMTSGLLLHSKFFLFDRNSVLAGSHNLSMSSLSKTRETSIYSKNETLIEKYFKYFNEVRSQCVSYGKSIRPVDTVSTIF